MIRKQNNNIHWLEFELLADIPNLSHRVFLRHGGYSQSPFNSLNVGCSTGDDPSSIENNLHAIKKIMGTTKLTGTKQVHSNLVCHLKSATDDVCNGYDALMTSEGDMALMIKHADCQATLFYDPINHAIANVHAGWRGSVGNIYSETIKSMKKAFGSHPSELLVCISPSLGPEKAEFINYKMELPKEFWSFQTKPNFFDFWAISEWQLTQQGILSHHIQIARECTYTNSQDYFSCRREKITGRHATCVALTCR